MAAGARSGPSARTTTAAPAWSGSAASPQRSEAPAPSSQSGHTTVRTVVSTSCAPRTTTTSSTALARTRSSTGSSSSACFGEPNRVDAPAARTTPQTPPSRTDGFERPPEQRTGEVDLEGRPRKWRRALELVRRGEQPWDRRDARQGQPRLAAEPRGGDADEGEREARAVHRLQVDARLRPRHVELEDQLAGLQRGHVSVVRGRQAVEPLDRELAAVGPQRRPEREQRGRRVGRMRRGAALVAEDRVLAVRTLARVAAVAAVQEARVLQPPVPTSGRLEQVA